MAFRVEISPRAFNDLDEIADYIKQRGSFEQAENWFNGIIAAIRTLEDLPHRCPVAEESEELGQEVRLLLYGKRNRRYRVYYAVQQTDHALDRHYPRISCEALGTEKPERRTTAEVDGRPRHVNSTHIGQNDPRIDLTILTAPL
jgi:plasmid stabilization system protein ParE